MSLRTISYAFIVCSCTSWACTTASTHKEENSTGDDGGPLGRGGSKSQPDEDSGAAAGPGDPGEPPDEEAGAGSPNTESDGGSEAANGGSGPAGGGASAHFFLPTGEPDNTAAPVLEVDRKGGVHALYPAYAGGDAYYAYCAPGCTKSSDVSVVHFQTEGTVANAMLALDHSDRPRILLSAYQKVYFASCEADCTDEGAWTTTEILDHRSDREVSGEALALDPEGRPRFVMHTYRAYLGIGQKTPETFLARCDDDCDDPDAWQFDRIADEIWEGSHLRYDANGTAHLATVVGTDDGKLTAYFECAENCGSEDGWSGIGFLPPYENDVEAVGIRASVALALTSGGAPRVLVLAKSTEGKKNIVYFACDEDCVQDNWAGSLVSDHDKVGAGIDLALDDNDRPRFVYTLDYNIGLAYCDREPCAGENSTWDLTKVESSSDIPADDIFLWENCTVGAWFFHSPSLAITSSGAPRVGYQARDISGGWSQPDPTKPGCVAGTDMTWTRLSLMKSYK